MAERFVLCSNCGTKNRIPEGKSGRPTCGQCGKPLAVGKFKDSNLNFGRIIMVCLGIGIAAYFYLDGAPSKQRTTPRPAEAITRTPVFIVPGIVRSSPYETLAPLGIKSQTGSNYYIKLVDLSGRTIMTAYVQGGQYFETLAPLGTYELRYAAGDTWYGERYLFGSDTVFSKATELFDFTFDGSQYSGYTVELIMQRNGNLRTTSISPSDF